MEFFVVDPKDFTFAEWTAKVRDFLKEDKLKYSEEEGELYYQGDDIAAAWDESTVLFKVRGTAPGLIEVRDSDRHFYVFTDDLDIFEDKEVKDAVGMSSRRAGALYGFTWQNTKGCRFHLGPANNFYYFYDEDEADYPPVLPIEDAWMLFFRSVQWISDNVSRIQDLRGVKIEDVNLDLDVDLTFAHSSSLDALTEVLVEEEGYERTKTGLRATFRDRDIGWVQRFVSVLPRDKADFEHAFVRACWRGTVGGKPGELFFVGIERRNLRPFIQMPVHRTSKELVEKFKVFFKGHRIDRQEYYL
ncbi:MAG: hypothetical protein EXR76_04045 [Myxococcales bacterium]|nr:hypothetical protein [Myxococcales bacterium]